MGKTRTIVAVILLLLSAAGAAWFLIWLVLDVNDLADRPEWSHYVATFLVVMSTILAVWMAFEAWRWRRMVTNRKAQRALARECESHVTSMEMVFWRDSEQSDSAYYLAMRRQAEKWLDKGEDIFRGTEFDGEFTLGPGDQGAMLDDICKHGDGVLRKLLEMKKQRLVEIAGILRAWQSSPSHKQ